MLRLVVLLATLVAVISSAAIPSTQDDKARSNEWRIVGGSETDISKHPHQVSMRYKGCDTCSFNHRCGGSIISKRIILTAAHCAVGVNANLVHIVAGINERNGVGLVVPVEKVITHENYSTNVAYENDVAILVLALDLDLNNYNIKAIGMADKQPANDEISTITGWGTTTEGGSPPDVLLEVEVPIVSNDICGDRYGPGLINDSMLCAGSIKGGKDACQGDSGGPLLVNGTLAGIVSWGYGCARPDYPGVYSSVANLRTWIDAAVSANS